MNSLNIILSYDYVSELINLTWQDILYGIKNKFLMENALIKYAIDELCVNENPSKLILELSCLQEGDSIYPYMDELMHLQQEQNVSDSSSKDKFLYVLLNWIYENKDKYKDPLEMVEYVYADFDYPEIISKFVKYMPLNEPSLGTIELNRERLFKYWKDYLDVQKLKYEKFDTELKQN